MPESENAPYSANLDATARESNAQQARGANAAGGSDEDGGQTSCGCCGSIYNGFINAVHVVLPPGGVLSSAFNMASASIGAGILGLPGATNSAGIALAMIYLLIITFFSVYAMRILAIAAEKTHIRTFEGLSRWLFPYGNYAFSYWAAFIRLFHSFAADVAYVISIGNCLKPIFETAHARQPDNKAIEYFNTTSGNRLLTTIVWLCVMMPMVIPKHIDSLRFASAFSVTFMVYFVVIIVVHSCMNGLRDNASKVRVSDANYNAAVDGDAIFLFRKGNGVVNSVGVFVFAYVCQINAMEVHADMRPEVRTTNNYTLAATLGMILCGTLYVLVCIFGYFDFGSDKLGNKSILLMFDPLDEPAVLVAYIGVMCKLCVAYALLTLAARNSVYYLIGWQSRYAPKKGSQQSAASVKEPVKDENDAEPSSGFDDANKVVVETPAEEVNQYDGTELYVDNIPYWQHIIVVVIITGASLLCGLFIPSINTVFGFAGSISGGFMAFIFPALFYMYTGNWTLKSVGYWDYFLTYAVLITGVVGVIFGTGGTIYSQI